MEPERIMQYAEKVPLFSTLKADELKKICRIMVSREFSGGEIIVHEDDDEGHSFFIIVAGKVHVTVMSSQGKQTILATLTPGDFFGEMSLLDGEPRSATVYAAEACAVLTVYRKEFMQILHDFPKITIQMLVEMSKRLRRANRHINTLSLMSVYGRVADVILQLGKEQGQRIGNVIVIPQRPTHQVMADMAGTSRETVSRVLSQLQKKHYISIDRSKLVIFDEEKLLD
jgi:CRP/FNR family transcriptional regulator/CRP/FNR family cyclic AMP-dependent transcriptional regulator